MECTNLIIYNYNKELVKYCNDDITTIVSNISEGNRRGIFYPKICDITEEESVVEVFEWADTLGGISVLVNNAGIIMRTSLLGEAFRVDHFY